MMVQDLHDKDFRNIRAAAEAAVLHREILQTLVDGLTAKDNVFRENCFHVVLDISETSPETLMPRWDDFAALLDSDNAFHRAIGAQTLARLTASDEENRLDGILERVLSILDDDKVMVSRYLVQNSGRIMKAKPYLTRVIVERLLRVDETRHPEGRKALLKADIIEVFETFYSEIEDTEPVMAFAEEALTSSSPKARKFAQAFLNVHANQT